MNLSPDEFLVPAKPHQSEIKIKGSRFIASIDRVKNRDEAEARYEGFRKKYYNATHNCLAYKIDENNFRYSDDGEPSGTAGKPMLQTLEGSSLLQIFCVVTRYFGGTKLGTGGLIRAYSEAVKSALHGLETRVVMRTVPLTLELRYDQEPLIRKMLDKYRGRIQDSNYLDQIKLNILLPQSLVDQFSAELIDSTQSTVKIVAS